MAESYKDLLTKRSSIKGQITKFKNYLESIIGQPKLSSINVAELALKLNKFEVLAAKFDELQTQIELLNSDSLDTEIDLRDRIEDDFIQYTARARNILEEQNNLKVLEQDKLRRESIFLEAQCGVENNNDFSVKLPQIQITKFDGSFFRWLEFRDTFMNLIHNNERIPSIQKFHYLISYLVGDAARVISNIQVSSANYSSAWQLLYDRYNNKRLLINHHLKSLFNIQQISKDSAGSLRYLVDHVTKNLRALSSLGQPTDHWDTIIIFMITSKLDNNTLIKWEEQRNNLGDIPTFDEFKSFLIDRAYVLETTQNMSQDKFTKFSHNNSHSSFNNNNNKNNFNSKVFTVTNQNNNTSFICIICSQNHKIYDCATFKGKSIPDRLADVTKFRLCSNCLRQGHPLSQCRMGPCKQCNKRHNTLLHPVDVTKVNNAQTEEIESISNFSNQGRQILLSTALIEVLNPVTKKVLQVKALMDSGSQSSFITKKLQTKLSLNSNPISLKILGIGCTSTNNAVNESCEVELNSLNSNFKSKLNCFVLEKITGNLPSFPISIHELELSPNIKLADPNFDRPSPIDLLIGADLYWDVLRNGLKSLGTNMPKLQNSVFGWLIGGPIGPHKPNNATFNNLMIHDISSDQSETDKLLTKFWELEQVADRPILSKIEKDCETHFKAHTFRLDTGRFCVKLPLVDSPECLGDSHSLAKKRFLNLEKRFRKNPILKSHYVEFIKEYKDLGHLSEAPGPIPVTCYFLCHHAVFKMDSESTKVRVVFDGSAPSSSGFSVNDLQMVGPNVQDSLFAILVRARQYKFLLTGDIEKMYRQVVVNESDRNLQLILWRENESSPIKTLQLNTVTYGTASASYLSTRCLWQIGEECNDPLIKAIIQKDFYVDDLITGSNNEAELSRIKNAVSSELTKGCLNLRKFKTNLPSIFDSDCKKLQDDLTFSESSSTLGLGWSPKSDTLHFPVNFKEVNKDIPTKRSIMSMAFMIFDPLGLLSPYIMQAKLMLQKLWQLKVDWDQPVPDDIMIQWTEFSKGFTTLPKFHIPRFVMCDSPKRIEFHCFTDASQVGYGACVYVRSTNSDGKHEIYILCSKSRVAPIKPTSIPKLELCGALLGARLCKSVMASLRYEPNRIIYWCDSTIVLSWLRGDPSRLKTFVANRVCEIQDTTGDSVWRYVPTGDNPADLISRGVSSQQLEGSTLWWHGPTFLLNEEVEWPALKREVNFDNLPEVKVVTAATAVEPVINFERFSNLNRLKRTVAYVKRFVYNLKNPKARLVGDLSVEELSESFKFICHLSQQESFLDEYKILNNKKQLKPNSNILSLSPFVDEDNLIRVGGRIDASGYSYDKRHPILLDSAHYLSKLIFRHEHTHNMHAGPQLLLGTVRQTIWPLRGRALARSTVRKCVRCQRVQGKTLTPKMGDLPTQRVTPDFPFATVGIDMAGPFFTLNRKGRGAKLTKSYLCVFVCFRYKCIHLEAVSDLTKDAFIMTLRRFCARRGKPVEIFTDNGRNFVGAANELNLFFKENNNSINEFAVQQSIKFTFIPSYSPHFGGIWEAGVKSAKHHIKRVMGNSHLTFEELTTLFAQVESILNSRPLCPLSSSPDDYLFLSPGHFLIGRPLNALPAPDLQDCNANRLQRYARLEQIRQHFWQRWQTEYIAELQQRTKWKQDKTKIQIGDLVLLAEDFSPPLCWRMGRIARLYPGPDGICRVADVNTPTGCFRRPLVRLCPLMMNEDL